MKKVDATIKLVAVILPPVEAAIHLGLGRSTIYSDIRHLVIGRVAALAVPCEWSSIKEIRLRRVILSVFLNLSLMACASASEDISSVWRDLFTRCRVAVETGKDFDANGLIDLGRDVRTTKPLTLPGLPNPLFSAYQMTEQRWKTREQRFMIIEAEFPPSGGKVRRSCDVELNREAQPISTAEEEALRAAFLVERTSLLNSGRHKSWDPDPILSTNLGIRLDGRNPRRCPVVSYLMIDTRPHLPSFFKSGAGEQAYDCGGAPQISHP